MPTEMTAAQEGQTVAVLQAILRERGRQHEKWGTQRHGAGDPWTVWLTVLSEEVGELAQEILRHRERNTKYVETFFLDQRMPETANPAALAAMRTMANDTLRTMRDEAIQVAAVAVAVVEHLDERIGELGSENLLCDL